MHVLSMYLAGTAIEYCWNPRQFRFSFDKTQRKVRHQKTERYILSKARDNRAESNYVNPNS